MTINKCPTLTELDISCTNLTDEFLEKLAPKIQIINLWGCRGISAKNTFKFIKSNPSIRMVMIDNLIESLYS